LTWATLFGVATLVTALNHTREVHATSVEDHHRGCSVASLKGTYAWRRTGVNESMGGPIAQMGLDVFNGDGKRGITRSTGISYVRARMQLNLSFLFAVRCSASTSS
jgi:hypothetical protein